MKIGKYIFFQRQVFASGGDPYLVRYTLFESPQRQIWLHHVLRSDADRELHDHPCDFTSLILWGGYIEESPAHRQPQFDEQDNMLTTKRAYAPGEILRRKATDIHRLEVYPGRTAWTLVFTGPKVRLWGFWKNGQWIEAREYIASTPGH